MKSKLLAKKVDSDEADMKWASNSAFPKVLGNAGAT